MNKINKLVITSIILSMVFVLAFAGTASASTTGSILMNYDTNGGADPDCAVLPTNGTCVPFGDGSDSGQNSVGSAQWDFCVNSAVRYASGLSDISGLQISYAQVSKEPARCLSGEGSNEANGTYATYRVSFSQPTPPPPPALNVFCSASASSVQTGQSVAFNASATGGTGSYTYSWSGACAGSGLNCSNIFSTSGTKTATVSATSGTQTATASCSVSVLAVACSTNSQCGTSGLIGSPFCKNGDVYKTYRTYTCNNAGTSNSYCSQADADQLQTNCTTNQTCSNGSCIDQEIPCSTNSQCGTNGLVGDPFCQGNNIYRSYKTYTCNNPGTINSYCSNSTSAQLQTNCTTNQTCSNGSCTNDCTPNYEQRCVGTSLYWYNSCGVRGSYIGTCGNTCTPNYQQRCDGNSMYWYDSCGNRGNYVGTCGNTGTLTVTKTVRNLTRGTGFATSTYANPSDVLMFLITLQASGNQGVSNVFVRDMLPANLIYNNQLVVARSNNASSNYSGDVAYGISLNTIPSGQTVTISYQVQVAGATNFAFGTTTLTNNVSVTSSGSGYNPTASASVVVTRTAVLGASSISTGLTNNFWVDSFFLPLLLTLIGLWMWRSGMFFGVERWFGNKRSEKELAIRTANLRKLGR